MGSLGEEAEPRGRILNSRANLHSELGGSRDLLAWRRAALEIAREVGDRTTEALSLQNSGDDLYDFGRPQDAMSNYQSALDIYRSTGHEGKVPSLELCLARTQTLLGLFEQAEANLQRVLLETRGGHLRANAGDAMGLLGELRRRQGRLDEAEASCQAALTRLREFGDRRGEGTVMTVLGEVLLAQGRETDAHGMLQAAEAMLLDIFYQVALAKTRTVQGRLALGQGRIDGSRAALAEAMQIAKSMGLGSASDVGVRLEELTDAIRRQDAVAPD